MTEEKESAPKMSAAARKAHADALAEELAMLKARPDSDAKTRRVGEVEAELKKYRSGRVSGGPRETA